MNRLSRYRLFALGVSLAMTALGMQSVLADGPMVPGGICAYLLLSLLPGAVLYRFATRDPDVLEMLLAAAALSPVLTGTAGVLLQLAGVSVQTTVFLLVAASGSAGILAVVVPRVGRSSFGLTRSQAFWLFGSLVIVCVAIAYLPFTREYWRVRADAWFHGAVIANIRAFGLPPEDPYFVGLPLQYMWFYHVGVLLLSEASHINPFYVMPLLNVQAMIVYGLGAFLLSSLFKKTFSHHYAAVVTAILGMNAVFWVFIPIKLLRSFAGDVRGIQEVKRMISLHPFDFHAVRSFVQVGYNQEFFLDKFMVATAFSLGLAMMSVLWYGTVKYLRDKTAFALLLVFLSAIGVTAFHTVIGVLTVAGLFGGLCLLFIFRRHVTDYEFRPTVRLLGTFVASGLILVPYLYSITHAKTGGEALPIGLSFSKMVGIFVSCALVIFLASFQFKRLFRTNDGSARFLLYATIAILAVCAIIALPARNANDKFPFLVFFPLSIIAGWSIADFSNSGRNTLTKRLRFILVAFLAFAPLNLLALAAYENTTPKFRTDENDRVIAPWIRINTPRESIFFDSRDRIPLLVAGPRRYYFGHRVYADMWGYDREEIAKRRHVTDNLFSLDDFDDLTLETLGSMSNDVYVIVREEEGLAGQQKFLGYSRLFKKVFSYGPVSVFAVDRAACRTRVAPQT